MVLGLLACGCQPGVKWDLRPYDDVHARALREKKLTFVYFRNWASVACTEFEDKVLKQPPVLQALEPLVCVPLDLLWDKALAERWGISEIPGCAVVGQDSQLLEKVQGAVSAEQLLSAVQAAKAKGAAAPAAPASQASRPVEMSKN
ncbi:MAG: hypothetical protein SF069_04265 [Phycisphaerae bacterium]|nr:hypothetical protein [Phycisphaerae bacterium]